MSTTIRARFSQGILEPLEPLDLEEGREVVLSIIDGDDSGTSLGGESILAMVERIRRSAPTDIWTNLPTDGARNVDHYLYGWPKDRD